MKNQNLRTLLILTSLGLASPAAIAADTIGWWRFEDSTNLGKDSSGNNLNLAVSSTTPAQVATPFHATIPQTGNTNTKALVFDSSGSIKNYLSTPDSAVFNFQAFTIEADISITSFNGTNPAVIAGQFGFETGNNANANWLFGVKTTGELYLRLGNSANQGTSYNDLSSGLFLTTGADAKNYYVGASVIADGSGTTAVFYLQDLSAGGDIQSVTKTASLKALTTTSTAPFVIGTSCNKDGGIYEYRNFGGTIDEVRLTNGILTQDQLLATTSTVPEPATWAMLTAGLILALTLIIRRYR
ncbi:LamG-like jellyroll fold domain-containing protein [Geminisphaera colitermitum]|uniref:LamG-like jellyroll fold domain-containing protein n=1 Tax=Geminisphaera colitermitum TaxID=1148786 RepID=UPI0001965601|nr:LamG-like jellyroll fold domain-containing protein [Geminisphaera colitermitum]